MAETPEELNNPTNEITRILGAMSQGETACSSNLFPIIYQELRKMARVKLSREADDHGLDATALVHEAWLRLGGGSPHTWQNRSHFFGAAAEAMRRILVDNARRRHRIKHGGKLERVELDEDLFPCPMPDDELLEVDEALEKLSVEDPRAAELVKLCFFVGMTQPEAASELGLSVSTVERTWAYARAWLYREIQSSRKAGPRGGTDTAQTGI